MDRIKCLIVDDEPVAQRILENYLVDLRECALIGKCKNAIIARELLEAKEVDLMFLDLKMPKLDGFAFLKTLDHPPAVIITTAYREFALESYELEVVDYLLKPIPFERFLKALNRYKKLTLPKSISPFIKEKKVYLYVKSDRKTVKLQQSDIFYIEGMNNYIQIHCAQKVHIVYSSLSNILKELEDSFIRIHKSFIINKDKIKAFTQEQVEIGQKQIPVGNTYREQLANL